MARRLLPVAPLAGSQNLLTLANVRMNENSVDQLPWRLTDDFRRPAHLNCGRLDPIIEAAQAATFEVTGNPGVTRPS